MVTTPAEDLAPQHIAAEACAVAAMHGATVEVRAPGTAGGDLYLGWLEGGVFAGRLSGPYRSWPVLRRVCTPPTPSLCRLSR